MLVLRGVIKVLLPTTKNTGSPTKDRCESDGALTFCQLCMASQESMLQRDTRTSFFRFRMELDYIYDMRKTITARLCLKNKANGTNK